MTKSTEYFKLSFENNPEKDMPYEKLKYYEVLFLYAMESSNIKEMEVNQKKAERIARQEKMNMSFPEPWIIRQLFMDLRRCQTVESIILKILSVFGIYKQTKSGSLY